MQSSALFIRNSVYMMFYIPKKTACDLKTKIVHSVTTRKVLVAYGVKISPVIGYNTNIPDIF